MNPGAVAALATELGIDPVVGPEAPLVTGVPGKAANQASTNRATFGMRVRPLAVPAGRILPNFATAASERAETVGGRRYVRTMMTETRPAPVELAAGAVLARARADRLTRSLTSSKRLVSATKMM